MTRRTVRRHARVGVTCGRDSGPGRDDRPPPSRPCRVCGLITTSSNPADLPWGRDGKSPNWDICECCGTEDGYEDTSPDAARAARERWLAKEAGWFEPKSQPPNWDLEEQLANVPVEYR